MGQWPPLLRLQWLEMGSRCMDGNAAGPLARIMMGWDELASLRIFAPPEYPGRVPSVVKPLRISLPRSPF
jgi:hypothetical protein